MFFCWLHEKKSLHNIPTYESICDIINTCIFLYLCYIVRNCYITPKAKLAKNQFFCLSYKIFQLWKI